MDVFKICRNTNKVQQNSRITPFEISLSGESVCFTVSNNDAVGLTFGSVLHFEKMGVGNNGRLVKICETDAEVIKVVPRKDTDLSDVYVEYILIEPLTVASFINIINEDTGNTFSYKFYFTGDTRFVRQDIEKYEEYYGEPYVFYVKNSDGDIESFYGLDFCYPHEIVRGEDIHYGTPDSCSVPDDRWFNYETMERNSILAKGVKVESGTLFDPYAGNSAIFSTNPYYFTHPESGVILFDNVTIEKYTDFMNLGIMLEDDYDAKRMYQEYQVNEQFVKKVKESIVPSFLDLEKLKYAPAFSGDTDVYLATGITFNPHFRSRIMDGPYSFEDTWHFSNGTNTWNGNDANSKVFQNQLYSNSGFVTSSNLMGFLGFTDDDIYNQKNKVKQSFLRLLFYDSNDPLTQNLLYYSTIFWDSGELFGRFVKRKAMLAARETEYNKEDTPVVWSKATSADTVGTVTSEFSVNDEYDMTKSGEGFNLYLFKQDAPFENNPQDIYMKVEFNHAGYGRTIPLIFWPKENNTPRDLTIESYLENLYIKVRISLTDKGYVYSFPDTVFVSADDDRKNGIIWENDRLIFNLFEPRITPEVIKIAEE